MTLRTVQTRGLRLLGDLLEVVKLGSASAGCEIMPTCVVYLAVLQPESSIHNPRSLVPSSPF